MKTLETYAQKALSFAKTFGLKPYKLELKSDLDKSVFLNLSSDSGTNYKNLDPHSKDQLKQLIFFVR